MEIGFLPYKEAFTLKELGFNERCFGYYNSKGDLRLSEVSTDGTYIPAYYANKYCSKWLGGLFESKSDKAKICAAPLYQQAFKWFRDTHGLYIHSCPEFYQNGINFNWQILWYLPKDRWNKSFVSDGTFIYGDNGEYPTQEDADFAALKKLIEIFKQRQSEK